MILTSIELEQIIKEEIEAVLSEAEHGPFKKIGQDIKRTSQKVGQDIKQAVGKLKRKPAETVPPNDPPLPPDGASYDPATKVGEARKTIVLGLEDWPHNAPRIPSSFYTQLRGELIDAGWPTGTASDQLRKVRYVWDEDKVEVQYIVRVNPQLDATADEYRRSAGLK